MLHDDPPIVFVVDDDSELCKAITWLLKSVNLQVKVYSHGQDFLDNYNPHYRGCLLLDIRMPVMGGFELFSELKTRNNRLPIIFITGHGDVEMAVRAMKEGALDFILKPFDDELLLQKVQKAIAENEKREIELKQNSDKNNLLRNLTRRELAVMKLIANGKLNKQISGELEISESTVEYHRANLMRKLNVRSVAELVKIYLFTEKMC